MVDPDILLPSFENYLTYISSTNKKEYQLHQNYPNPFNAVTIIKFEILDFKHVNLTIFNILGQKITTLVDKQMGPGIFQVKWYGQNQQYNRVSSGIYLAVLKIENDYFTKKITLIK